MFQVGYKERCVRSLMSMNAVQGLAPGLAAYMCDPDASLSRTFTIDFHGYHYRGQIKNRLDWCAYFLKSYAVAEATFVTAVADFHRRQGQRFACWDVGANVGLRTLMMARVADDVRAFEPVPGAFERLQDKVESNQLDHVHCFAATIDEHPGKIDVDVISPINFMVAKRRQPQAKAAFGSLTVSAVNGDSFLHRYPADLPNFIRIDSRSDAIGALKGMTEILRQSRPVVLIEAPSIISEAAFDEESLRAVLYDDVDIVTFDESPLDGSFSIRPLEPTSQKLVCYPSALRRLTEPNPRKSIGWA